MIGKCKYLELNMLKHKFLESNALKCMPIEREKQHMQDYLIRIIEIQFGLMCFY